MLKRLAVLLLTSSTLTISVATTSSCGTGGGVGGGTGGSGGTGGMADPDLVCDASPPATTFAKVYSDVFTPSCLSCHKMGIGDGSDSYGRYETQALAYEGVGKTSLYAGSEKTLKIVDPGKLDNSSMFMKCLAKAKSPAGKNLGGAMPLGAAALTAAQKQTLKDWICSGAKM